MPIETALNEVKKMTMKDRIKQLMESQKKTQQEFAQLLGMSPSTLSSIFNDRTRPTLNIVEAIKICIPEINTDWLMFGIGDMYVSSEVQSEASHPSPTNMSEPNLFDSSSASEQVLNFGMPPRDVHPSSKDHSHQSVSGVSFRHSAPDSMRDEVKYVERPPRKVTEIRVYYDDLTYETFVPSKK